MKEVQLISGPFNGNMVPVPDEQVHIVLVNPRDGKRYLYSLGRFAAFIGEVKDSSDHPAGSGQLRKDNADAAAPDQKPGE